MPPGGKRLGPVLASLEDKPRRGDTGPLDLLGDLVRSLPEGNALPRGLEPVSPERWIDGPGRQHRRGRARRRPRGGVREIDRRHLSHRLRSPGPGGAGVCRPRPSGDVSHRPKRPYRKKGVRRPGLDEAGRARAGEASPPWTGRLGPLSKTPYNLPYRNPKSSQAPTAIRMAPT